MITPAACGEARAAQRPARVCPLSRARLAGPSGSALPLRVPAGDFDRTCRRGQDDIHMQAQMALDRRKPGTISAYLHAGRGWVSVVREQRLLNAPRDDLATRRTAWWWQHHHVRLRGSPGLLCGTRPSSTSLRSGGLVMLIDLAIFACIAHEWGSPHVLSLFMCSSAEPRAGKFGASIQSGNAANTAAAVGSIWPA